MYCNLRPPAVTPVILGFNYQTLNAPAYILTNPLSLHTHSAPTRQISATLDNLLRTYCDVNMSSLGTIYHLGFHQERVLRILPLLNTCDAST